MERTALEVVKDFLCAYDLIDNSSLEDDLCSYIIDACSGICLVTNFQNINNNQAQVIYCPQRTRNVW